MMRLYAASGQPASALRQYHELERLLQQDLGETPSEASRRLAEEIGRSGVQAFGHGATDDQRRTTNDRNPTTSPPHHLTTSPRAAVLEPVGVST